MGRFDPRRTGEGPRVKSIVFAPGVCARHKLGDEALRFKCLGASSALALQVLLRVKCGVSGHRRQRIMVAVSDSCAGDWLSRDWSRNLS
jgi:hypothetical protein